MKTIEIIVYGKVQGVFFRASTQREALALGLTGTVQNKPDNTVFIRATGKQTNLDKLIAWCQTGSSAARVESVSTKEVSLLKTPEKTFLIIR